MPESPELLAICDIFAGYGEINILWGVDLSLKQGEITALVGSNGAGKSTLMRVLSGLLEAAEGQITFAGKELGGCTPAEILDAGIAHVPEGRRLFGAMSVEENLLIGAYARKATRRAIANDLSDVYSYFPKLYERRRQAAGTMSGGEQQMCAIGRGLMMAPRLLMIDELSLGLSPLMVEQLISVLLALNRQGLSMLIVEQDVVTALELSTQAFVMEMGRIVQSGKSADLITNPEVKRAYLGQLDD